MSKFNLTEFIQKQVKIFLVEKYISEKLAVDDPNNLHGDERTQRQFVMDLAAQNPFGLISISDIADALDTTRDAIRDNYARQIRFYADREDFDKVISEVPFRSAAVYQLVSRARSAPLSKQQMEQIKKEEEKKYDDTTGVYYSIYVWSKGDINPLTIAYLNLRDDDDINKYKKMLPKQQVLYGELYNYRINDKKIARVPEKDEDKIITPEQFKQFIKKEFDEND